jgi:hypothetical protein
MSLREGFDRIMNSKDEEQFHTQKILNRMHKIGRIAAPKAYLAETIPALTHLPEFPAPFKKEAKALQEAESYYFRVFSRKPVKITRKASQNPRRPSPAAGWRRRATESYPLLKCLT